MYELRLPRHIFLLYQLVPLQCIGCHCKHALSSRQAGRLAGMSDGPHNLGQPCRGHTMHILNILFVYLRSGLLHSGSPTQHPCMHGHLRWIRFNPKQCNTPATTCRCKASLTESVPPMVEWSQQRCCSGRRHQQAHLYMVAFARGAPGSSSALAL